jgi:hypothetical protein
MQLDTRAADVTFDLFIGILLRTLVIYGDYWFSRILSVEVKWKVHSVMIILSQQQDHLGRFYFYTSNSSSSRPPRLLNIRGEFATFFSRSFTQRSMIHARRKISCEVATSFQSCRVFTSGPSGSNFFLQQCEIFSSHFNHFSLVPPPSSSFESTSFFLSLVICREYKKLFF